MVKQGPISRYQLKAKRNGSRRDVLITIVYYSFPMTNVIDLVTCLYGRQLMSVVIVWGQSYTVQRNDVFFQQVFSNRSAS